MHSAAQRRPHPAGSTQLAATTQQTFDQKVEYVMMVRGKHDCDTPQRQQPQESLSGGTTAQRINITGQTRKHLLAR